MKIINIPIEPLEERYSVQWDKWFFNEFQKRSINFETVYGDTTITGVQHGSFLDVIETNLYKTSQLTKILDIVAHYDDKEPMVLFFHDLWFPGLINIAYMRDGLGLKNLKICGCLHAGSYDEYDFLNKTGMTVWAEHFENSIFQIVDKVFVATEYHKNLLMHNREAIPTVTGFPIYDEFSKPCKNNIIVFPHRLDEEKLPVLFDEFSNTHEKNLQAFQWKKTKDVCKTKQEYYDLLNKSFIAISFARQETWGIAMQEAVICGCYPIVPDRLSYMEMYHSDFIYEDLDEAKAMIWNFSNNPPKESLQKTRDTILKHGAAAIPRMIKEMKGMVK
jgi:hypothetical protein